MTSNLLLYLSFEIHRWFLSLKFFHIHTHLQPLASPSIAFDTLDIQKKMKNHHHHHHHVYRLVFQQQQFVYEMKKKLFDPL